MAGSSNTLNIPIALTLTKEAYDVLVGDSGNPGPRLAARASRAMNELAAGGIMVTGKTLDYFAECAQQPINDERELQAVVDGALKSRFGRRLVEYEIDPAMLGMYEEMAKMQGITVERLVQDVIAQAFDLGWLSAFNHQTAMVALTREQQKALAGKLGKETFTGADLCRALGVEE